MPGDPPALFTRFSAVYPPERPVSIVSHAGQAGRQKVILGTLADIGAKFDAVEANRALVYVGKALAKIPASLAKASGPGKYYLVGMGHRLALEIELPGTGGQAATQAAPESPAPPAARSRVLSLIGGLGIIFGLFGFLFGWKARHAFGWRPPAA